jgi:hypothetical protein
LHSIGQECLHTPTISDENQSQPFIIITDINGLYCLSANGNYQEVFISIFFSLSLTKSGKYPETTTPSNKTGSEHRHLVKALKDIAQILLLNNEQ